MDLFIETPKQVNDRLERERRSQDAWLRAMQEQYAAQQAGLGAPVVQQVGCRVPVDQQIGSDAPKSSPSNAAGRVVVASVLVCACSRSSCSFPLGSQRCLSGRMF